MRTISGDSGLCIGFSGFVPQLEWLLCSSPVGTIRWRYLGLRISVQISLGRRGDCLFCHNSSLVFTQLNHQPPTIPSEGLHQLLGKVLHSPPFSHPCCLTVSHQVMVVAAGSLVWRECSRSSSSSLWASPPLPPPDCWKSGKVNRSESRDKPHVDPSWLVAWYSGL